MKRLHSVSRTHTAELDKALGMTPRGPVIYL